MAPFRRACQNPACFVQVLPGVVSMVLLVLSVLLLCVAMAFALRGAAPNGSPIIFTGFDGIGVLLGFVAFVTAAAAHGTSFGLWLLAALMLHEAGHVLAYRMLGHAPTRFRLVPLLSRLPISDRPLKSEGEAFFVALMGAGFSLAPMALAFVLSSMLAATEPALATQLQTFAVTIGALNFVNLLPFPLLDGGRCARIAARSFWPALAPAMTAFMVAAFFAAALRTQSPVLLVLVGLGLSGLLPRKADRPQELAPLGPSGALTALAAYVFTLAAHFSAGWLLLEYYLQ